MIAHGVVIAGVDLSKLSRDDITISDGVVLVDLPDPEIFIATLDNQKSSVYDRETVCSGKATRTWKRWPGRQPSRNLPDGAEDGILQQANDNAEISSNGWWAIWL